MRLYHVRKSRSERVTWLCEEIGVPIEIINVDMRNQPPELQALNPSHTVPLLVDGDHAITESIAALMYIAALHSPTSLSIGPGESGYADYLQFMVLGEAGLLAPLDALIRTTFKAPEGEKENFTTRAIIDKLKGRAKILDQKLQQSDYLAANRFTAADISVAFAVGVAINMLGLKDIYPDSVIAHYQRMVARPAFQKACPR